MRKPDFNNAHAKRNPFQVPDGYFDGLTAQVMAAIEKSEATTEERKPVAKKVPFYKTEMYAKIKPYLYMAAMFGCLYFGIWVYKYQQRIVAEKSQTLAQVSATQNDDAYEMSAQEMDDYIDDACDYMMIGHQDIMACVTEEN